MYSTVPARQGRPPPRPILIDMIALIGFRFSNGSKILMGYSLPGATFSDLFVFASPDKLHVVLYIWKIQKSSLKKKLFSRSNKPRAGIDQSTTRWLYAVSIQHFPLSNTHAPSLTLELSVSRSRSRVTRIAEVSHLLILSLLISIEGARASRPRGARARKIHFSQILYSTLRRTSHHSGGPRNFDKLVISGPYAAARSHASACFYRTCKTRRVRDLCNVF